MGDIEKEMKLELRIKSIENIIFSATGLYVLFILLIKLIGFMGKIKPDTLGYFLGYLILLIMIIIGGLSGFLYFNFLISLYNTITYPAKDILEKLMGFFPKIKKFFNLIFNILKFAFIFGLIWIILYGSYKLYYLNLTAFWSVIPPMGLTILIILFQIKRENSRLIKQF